MTYRRVLLLAEAGGDVRSAVALIRRVAPSAERLVVVARLPARKVAWLSQAAPPDQRAAATSSVEAIREAAAGAAASVEVKLAPDLSVGELAAMASESQIDLLAATPSLSGAISVLSELRKRLSLAVLWTAGEPSVGRSHPLREIASVAFGARARAALAAFLRDHGSPDLRCTVLVPEPPAPGRLASALGVAGVTARVEFATPGSPMPTAVDLLVLTRFPGAPLAVSSAWPAPILVLPPLSIPLPIRRAVDAADPVDLGDGLLRVRITYASGVGRLEPIPDQEVAFVSGGRVGETVTTVNGQAEIRDRGADAFGFFRTAGTAAPEVMGQPLRGFPRPLPDPLDAVEEQVAVIRPGARPLLLFDSDLSNEDLGRLAALGGEDAPELLAVRMRPIRSCASIRARLHAVGLPPRVADASAVLDEGAALDVPETVDPVRLARVAARMHGGSGFPVAAIVHGGPHAPRTIGFEALRAGEAAAIRVWRVEPRAAPPSLASRLDATTGAPGIAGNRVELELDNAKARRWLLEAIAGAKRRVHFQVYMGADDDAGTEVEAALAAAGARGVAVRVVVDSLHGFEGSLGAHNPLFSRLAGRPGVELRVLRPISGLPSLEDLKQRDHRKIVVVDGVLALVGGRNLSHEYYTGFGEVTLTPGSSWRQVPWLDAGARVEGPAVAALERSFLGAWTGAGGEPFEVDEPPPTGDTAVRLVVHHGLRDAATLEAYLALIDSAESHVYAVNGFPLILEIQHALLRALRRGVRVRTLIGHLTPTHGVTPFGGPWSSARTTASELVDSRMDAVVAAGGEAYRLVVPEQPGWSPGLGAIQPHVHAKVVSVDGRVCSVGSANLDITAGYWESELLLVVEDPGIARALEASIDELMAGSEGIDRDDPAWKESAERRRWMRYWPGVLSV